jgi:nucleoside-diphosphate-sugar epimerase
MRVFVTGATGWVGSRTVDELLANGYEVTGLARSDASAAALEAKGARVQRGDLDDFAGIRAGAETADAVIHLAAKRDWSNPAAQAAAERGAIATIGDVLAGSGRPFLIASGLAGIAQDRPVTEDDPSPFRGPDSMRGGAENFAFEYVDKGVRSMVSRFAPTVHGTHNRGFTGSLVTVAYEKGVSGYPGDGTNRWAAVHVSDAARMIRLGLEKAPAGTRLHAVAEEGIPVREIAEAIGRYLDVPVTSIDPADTMEHFGFVGRFVAMEMSGTSTATRELLGWTPTGPTLIEDIEAGAYSVPSKA